MPGHKGAFVICTFWPATLFERLLECRNDLGLLAEEIDPGSDESLGNFPRAFSHVGLIGAAMNLRKAMDNNSTSASPP
ncbi:MAG: hypothetical protein M3276_07350 [Actinomycetota bacterium]|nr:hypothetical protein [Actinomycetota bacterium]